MGLRDLFKKKVNATEPAENEGSDDLCEHKAVLENLRSGGDDANIVRPVLHYCYFKKKKDLGKFIEILERTGAQYEPSKVDLGVIVTTASSMIEEEILSDIKSISDSVRICGGEYDGWETQLVTNDQDT
jgi:hypothetical protein